MERKPEHLVEDPNLRAESISQASWDEWALANAPFFLLPNASDLVESQMRSMGMDATYEDALAVAHESWMNTLDPTTTFGEILYLQGYSHVQRKHIIDQRHAELVRRAVDVGLIEERGVDKEFRHQFGE